MKAVRIHAYGNEEVLRLENIPVPDIAADELLVKIYAASVNPVDWKVREGYLQARNLHKLPLTLGWDFSGVVEKTGKSVTDFQPGDAVFSRPPVERDGSYAEFIAVKANQVTLKPHSLTHREAAGIPLAGITAWEALVTTAAIEPGQKILIHAASGGVGTLAVQIAKAKDCYVVGTTSGENVELVKQIGADEVIDYTKQDFSEVLHDMDVVFDTLGGQVQDNSWKVLKKGGMLVSIARPPDQKIALRDGVKAGYIFIGPNVPVLNALSCLIDGGRIKPVIDKVFTLEDIKQAHLYSQSGKAKGKIIIEIIPEGK